MKRYLYALVIILGVMFVGFTHNNFEARNAAPERMAAPPDTLRLVKIHVEGLTPARLDLVRDAFLSVPGVISVDLRSEKKEAVVRFDISRTDLRSIQNGLHTAGFTPYFH